MGEGDMRGREIGEGDIREGGMGEMREGGMREEE